MKTLLILLTSIFIANNAYADRIRTLVNDNDALQARVDIIQQAKSEILVEYFSVWNDDQSVGGVALLLDAARRGVKVKVIIDALANKVPKSFFTTLEERARDAQGNVNIEVRLYNPFTLNLAKLTRRDHSKMIIVDGKIMITGGRNVGDKYFGFNNKRNFKDLDVILDGSAVQAARQNFMQVFNSSIVKDTIKQKDLPSFVIGKPCQQPAYEDRERCERRKKVILKRYNEALTRMEQILESIMNSSNDDILKSNTGTDWLANMPNTAQLEFISHKPDELVTKKTAYLSHAILKLVSESQKELNIMSPYLIPTKEVMSLFQELLNRGVKIRVVTNSLLSTDNFFAQAAYQATKEEMTKMGIEIYEYNGPDTAHGKAFIIDGKVGFVGTFNLDPRSLNLNREVGIIIRNDDVFMKDLESEIETFRQDSLLVSKDGKAQNLEEQKKRYKTLSPAKRALVRIIRLFVPVFKSQVY